MDDENIINVYYEVDNADIASTLNLGDIEYTVLNALAQRLVTEMHKRELVRIEQQTSMVDNKTKFKASVIVISEDMYSHFRRCEDELDNYVYGGYE